MKTIYEDWRDFFQTFGDEDVQNLSVTVEELYFFINVRLRSEINDVWEQLKEGDNG